MSQAVWTGTITFGLVNIPVKLYPATEPKDVRFHLYDRQTGKRVRYERVTRDEERPTFEPAASSPVAPGEDRAESRPADRTERAPSGATVAAAAVEPEDILRGIELPGGELVTVTEGELRTAKQLITALAAEWVPEKHADAYREELLELLRSKPAAPPAEAIEAAGGGEIGDLMTALRASVEAAKRKGAKKTASSKRAG